MGAHHKPQAMSQQRAIQSFMNKIGRAHRNEYSIEVLLFILSEHHYRQCHPSSTRADAHARHWKQAKHPAGLTHRSNTRSGIFQCLHDAIFSISASMIESSGESVSRMHAASADHHQLSILSLIVVLIEILKQTTDLLWDSGLL